MIEEIELFNFKKHNIFSQKLNSKINLFFGENGVGKTSILEAINLCMPGKSLFSTQIKDLITFEKDSFEIKLKGEFDLSILYMQEKKIIKINKIQKKALEILDYYRVFGITPYLSLAFWKDSTLKRRYIDRIIMQQDPNFAKFYLKYAKALKHRNELIESNKFNDGWANAIEPIIKHEGMLLTKIRTEVLSKVSKITSEIENFIGGYLNITFSPTLQEQEDIFKFRLKDSFIGPHLTKFHLGNNNFQDKFASTGQQKKLLLALTIASLPKNSDTTNILLLDDVFANLDNDTIEKLISLLNNQSFQTIITNIEPIKNQNIACYKIK